jgi:hypothetical protein
VCIHVGDGGFVSYIWYWTMSDGFDRRSRSQAATNPPTNESTHPVPLVQEAEVGRLEALGRAEEDVARLGGEGGADLPHRVHQLCYGCFVFCLGV